MVLSRDRIAGVRLPVSRSEEPIRQPGEEPASSSGATRLLKTPAVLPHGAALLIVMLTYWTVDIVSPALPAIKADLSLTAAGAGLVFSLMFLGRLLGNVPATLVLERWGAPFTSVAGGVILSGGSALAAVAPSSEVLMAARILQGAGISLIVNAGLRSILKARPAQGAAMTYFGLAATAGGVFGLQSGGELTDAVGWRSIFALSAAIAVAVAIVSMFNSRGAGDANVIEPAPATNETKEPASYSEMAGPLLINFVVFANYSIWVVLPLYAERSFSASSNTTANLLMVVTVVHLAAALPVGALIRRFGSNLVLVCGLFVSLTGTVLVLPAPGLLWITIPLVLYGMGQVAAVNAGGDIVLQRGSGSSKAIGSLRLSSDLGLVIGPIVAGAMADAFGYGAPFATLPVLMGCSGVVALFLLMIRPQRPITTAGAESEVPRR